MTAADNKDKKEVKQTFESLVNMSASQIENWLDSDESTGHKSGKHIVLEKRRLI